MKMPKSLQFALIGLLVSAVLYLPVSMLLNTANAASKEGVLQTAQKEEILPMPSLPSNSDNGLSPNEYTSESYIQPQYDPFNNKYKPYHDFEDEIELIDRAANTPPNAKFSVRSKQKGLADSNSGTTATEFIFDAYSSTDNETKNSNLLVRWDFESDGELDSYFSQTKQISHKYEKPGIYTVTLEVSDLDGLISKTTQEIKVVKNDAPFAFFTYTPTNGTSEKIFTFKTGESYDNQFQDYYLEYRFDWNGDGLFDTPYKQKTIWNHKFEEPDTYLVIMEAKDPEGAVAVTQSYIQVFENTPPVAKFAVERTQIKVSGGYNGEPVVYRDRYYFDASESTDAENPAKLKYRWDFNYTGANDIQFDTLWSSAAKKDGFYDFTGAKTVRLQVKDEDGAIVTAYAHFNV